MTSRAAKLRMPLGFVLVLATVAGVWTTTIPVRAAGRSRDSVVQWDRQHKRTEERKTKRREDLDARGAEARDAKTSAHENRQSQMQEQVGRPNPQTDRWSAF